jgi:hypothetical protein
VSRDRWKRFLDLAVAEVRLKPGEWFVREAEPACRSV